MPTCCHGVQWYFCLHLLQFRGPSFSLCACVFEHVQSCATACASFHKCDNHCCCCFCSSPTAVSYSVLLKSLFIYFSGAEMLSYPWSIYLKKEKGIQTFPHSPHSSTHPAWEGSTTILLFNPSFSSWSKKETWQKAAGTPASSETQSGSFTALGKCVFRCYCTFILVEITSQKSQKTVKMQPIEKKRMIYEFSQM